MMKFSDMQARTTYRGYISYSLSLSFSNYDTLILNAILALLAIGAEVLLCRSADNTSTPAVTLTAIYGSKKRVISERFAFGSGKVNPQDMLS